MGTSRKATDQDATVGRLVQRLRKRAGKTQEMLARDLGITYQQLGKYERGESGFRFTTVCRIAALLGVPVTIFIEAVARPGLAESPAPYDAAPHVTASEDFARAFDEAIRLWRAAGREGHDTSTFGRTPPTAPTGLIGTGLRRENQD